ncbi:unnamed protein product [Lymnaea stagnalis]|uniref:DUF4773 domain-containing protein n=1 Tax=Lymnaea stagnalis TaxID=6523 RepID=A0AAV2HMH1_LYMST
MSTKMATLRRFAMRKKRCILLCLGGCLVFTFASWFSAYSGKDSSVLHITENVTPKPVEPKFNVIEPPKAMNIRVFGSEDTTAILTTEVKKITTDIKDILRQEKSLSNSSIEIDSSHNHTEDIEVVKNKTLSQLGLLGGKEKEKNTPKALFIKLKWNLTVSFEDIGNIMKDTEFLNKLKPLNLSGPMLTSARNRTSNFSLSMPIKMGYCDCWERYCFCCVQLVNEKLHLNNKICVNFTFISKSHEFEITFGIDSKPIYSGIISADAPPLLCLGSNPTVADMCVHFFNTVYRVDRLGLHKSQILGCTAISLNIYNKTISVFPVDCFQIPGDPNHHHEKENIILPNFVP